MASISEQAQDIPTDELRSQLDGELITPNDSSYDEARHVFFKGIDRRPLAVARVAGAADVARVVTAARETGLDLAVRSGGHNRAGHGTSEGGLVIDLSGMNAVEIDPDGESAWVETGATAGQYTKATGERGRVTGFGDTGSVGVGGITLAGGIGFLVRKNGMTIDDLLAAEVVTADGEVVEASEASEPDLFWAIRGGESNFGIATRFRFRLHEISEIVGGMMILPGTPETINGFLEAADAAPEELSTIVNVALAPPMPFVPEEAHGKPVIMGLFAYTGPVDQGDSVIAPFRALAEPFVDMVRPMRYPELYEGPEQEAALHDRDELLRRLARCGRRGGDPRAAAAVDGADEGRPAAGARRGDGPDAQRRHGLRPPRPLAVRQRRVDVRRPGGGAGARRLDERARGVTRQGRGGGYVAFMGEEDEETIRAAYPNGAWERLRELKRRYDPDNLFRLNHNIPPADG